MHLLLLVRQIVTSSVLVTFSNAMEGLIKVGFASSPDQPTLEIGKLRPYLVGIGRHVHNSPSTHPLLYLDAGQIYLSIPTSTP